MKVDETVTAATIFLPDAQDDADYVALERTAVMLLSVRAGLRTLRDRVENGTSSQVADKSR